MPDTLIDERLDVEILEELDFEYHEQCQWVDCEGEADALLELGCCGEAIPLCDEHSAAENERLKTGVDDYHRVCERLIPSWRFLPIPKGGAS